LPADARSVDVEFSANASNGYSADLKSEGDKIQLSLSRGFLPGLIYTFHGHASADGIKARIADLGSINLHFLPTGKERTVRPPGRCEGRRAELTEGDFFGSFRFRAERGATKIDVAHVKGSVAMPGWNCPHESFDDFLRSRPKGYAVTFLRADDAKRQVGLLAFGGTDAEHPDPEGAEISADMITRRGPVRVDHLAVLLGTSLFDFDSALTSATVAPPSPFHGSATYCASCEPDARWSGDLRVSLPALPGEIPLTGPDYDASLQRMQTGTQVP